MASEGAQRAGRVLVVAGACGGVGASVLASAVALRGERAGRRTVLVDACPLGGGLDVTVGVEQQRGLRWPQLAGLSGQPDGAAILARLPGYDGVPVLSHDRTGPPGPDCVVVAGVARAFADVCDLVVVDLSLDPGGVVLNEADSCLLVGGSTLRQVAALSVTVRHVRQDLGFAGPLSCCLADDGSGAEVADLVDDELALRVLATLGRDRGLAADVAHGVPPGSRGRGPVVDAADAVLAWTLEVGVGRVRDGGSARGRRAA